MGSNKKILAGKIGAPHGVKGWVKVFSYTDPTENLLDYQPWWLKIKQELVPFQIENADAHADILRVAFENIRDRDQAAALTHTEVYIERAQLPPLKEGEYYWSDLEGLTVRNLQGVELGKITHLMSAGGGDVMFIQGERASCLPYRPGTVIKSVDLDQKLMLVDWDENN